MKPADAVRAQGKVLILRALPFGADSRATRWAEIYAHRKVEWGCWGSKAPEHRLWNILHNRPRAGFFGLALGYAAFVLATFFFVLRRVRRGDILLCIDLETALLGAPAAWLRGARVHYDMADPFFLAKPIPFKWVWKSLERLCVQRANIATGPLALRFHLFFQDLPANCRVVENVPQIPASTRRHDFLAAVGGKRTLTFGYFGTLEKHRGLEDLVCFVKEHPDTRLVLGGRGPLANWVAAESASCERIQYVGEYRPDELGRLTRDVDVYCSFYYRTKPLHLVAAPNKYYEHLALGIPILMSACTPFAAEVASHQTGWVVEDGLIAMEAWYVSVCHDPAAFASASAKAHALWVDRYTDWLQRQHRCFEGV